MAPELRCGVDIGLREVRRAAGDLLGDSGGGEGVSAEAGPGGVGGTAEGGDVAAVGGFGTSAYGARRLGIDGEEAEGEFRLCERE